MQVINFKPTVANQSKFEVCFYFFPIDKHVQKLFHLVFAQDKVKNMEKLGPNCAQLFLGNKCSVFSMGGTVALRSPIPTLKTGELQTYSYLVNTDPEFKSTGDFS